MQADGSAEGALEPVQQARAGHDQHEGVVASSECGGGSQQCEQGGCGSGGSEQPPPAPAGSVPAPGTTCMKCRKQEAQVGIGCQAGANQIAELRPRKALEQLVPTAVSPAQPTLHPTHICRWWRAAASRSATPACTNSCLPRSATRCACMASSSRGRRWRSPFLGGRLRRRCCASLQSCATRAPTAPRVARCAGRGRAGWWGAVCWGARWLRRPQVAWLSAAGVRSCLHSVSAWLGSRARCMAAQVPFKHSLLL